jgi:hypothetical protein
VQIFWCLAVPEEVLLSKTDGVIVVIPYYGFVDIHAILVATSTRRERRCQFRQRRRRIIFLEKDYETLLSYYSHLPG